MKLKKFLAFFISLLLLGAILTATQVTVIKAGRIIDPETATAEENVLIIIKGHTIKEIGRDLKIPEKAKIIEHLDKGWIEKFPTPESQKKEIERLQALEKNYDKKL